MTKILDVIMVGKTRAVIGRVNEDGTYAVVYSNGINDVCEDAQLVDDK